MTMETSKCDEELDRNDGERRREREREREDDNWILAAFTLIARSISSLLAKGGNSFVVLYC